MKEQRPQINTIRNNVGITEKEHFQNEVLRPIIKMKSDLLFTYMKSYLIKKNNPLVGLKRHKQIEYIESLLTKDQVMRSEMRGIIIGHFSQSEFEEYSGLKNELNRRIMAIILTRMIDQIDRLIEG